MPVVETVPVDTAVEVFDQMEKGEIQGRKVLDFTSKHISLNIIVII